MLDEFFVQTVVPIDGYFLIVKYDFKLILTSIHAVVTLINQIDWI